MADTTTMGRSPDGRAAVVKHGDPRRLARERAMLQSAAHPGVVELAEVPEGLEGGDSLLCTVFVGGGTVGEQLTRSIEARMAVALAISLSATVADLHDRGIAHRRLTPDHVLVGDGRAVVCGLAEAVVAGEQRPAAFGEEDVAAVAQLVADLAAASAGAEATSLHRVAHRVLGASREGRPSMRGLAGALAGLAPEGTEPYGRSAPAGARRLTPRTAGPHDRHPSARLVRTRSAAALAFVLAIAGLGWQLLTPAAPAPQARTAPATTATVAPRSGAALNAPPSDRAPRRLWPASTCPPAAAPSAADLDGDGCDEPVHVEAGVVSSTGRRWQVAGPLDVVTLGDWDCDGRATPAVLQPGSGQLWVFDRWADAGEEVTARLAGVVRDAAWAQTVAPPEGTTSGCDRIEVLHPDDTSTVVTPPISPHGPTPSGVNADGWPPRWPGAGRRP